MKETNDNEKKVFHAISTMFFFRAVLGLGVVEQTCERFNQFHPTGFSQKTSCFQGIQKETSGVKWVDSQNVKNYYPYTVNVKLLSPRGSRKIICNEIAFHAE